MPCAVRLSDDKIDAFLKTFSDFSEVCRLGGLKPYPCKVSRSELFTNTSPRKGMETVTQRREFNTRIGNVAFTNTSPRKGMETPGIRSAVAL